MSKFTDYNTCIAGFSFTILILPFIIMILVLTAVYIMIKHVKNNLVRWI